MDTVPPIGTNSAIKIRDGTGNKAHGIHNVDAVVNSL